MQPEISERSFEANEPRPIARDTGPIEESLSRFAAQMEGIFACAIADGACDCCGRRHCSVATQLHWSAIYHSAATLFGSFLGAIAFMGVGHGMTCYERIEFSTYHSFCSRCIWKLRLKNLLGEFVEKISFAVLLVGLLAFIPTLLLAPFILFHDPTRRELLVLVAGLGGGLTALLIGWFGAVASRRWFLPGVLQRIGQKPFVLRAIESL